MPDPDLTDDWMNPKPAATYVHKEPRPGEIEYLIEREKLIVCFGNPGSITRWEYWSGHDTAVERDDRLKVLRERHPAWHLRARDSQPWLDRIRSVF